VRQFGFKPMRDRIAGRGGGKPIDAMLDDGDNMPDQPPLQTQLLDEVIALRARVSELEMAEKLRQQAEEALRQSEEKYRGLFENASIGIFHSLPEGRFLRVNPRLAEMLRYASPEELVSTITDIRTQIYIDSNRHANLLAVTQQRLGWVYAENRYRRKDGSILIANLAVRQVLQPDGTVAYLEGFVEDITDRKQAEDALRDGEERYRIVADNTSDWEFWQGPTGQFIYMSPSCERLTGYTAAEFARETNLLWRIVHPADRARFEAHRHPLRPDPNQTEFAFRIITATGEEKWVGHVCQPVYDGHGNYLGTRGSNRDITERQRLVAAEHEQRTLAEALRDTAEALTGTLNVDEVFDRVLLNVGRVIPHQAANIMLLDEARTTAAIARYYGYRPAGYDAYSLRLTLAEIRNLRTLFETGQPLVIEDVHQYAGWFIHPGREWIHSYAGVPIRIQGDVIGFLNLYGAVPGFYSESQAGRLQAFADQAAIAIQNAQLHAQLQRHADELEQRVAERTRELSSANERLTELDRLKDEFIARIGHELRTPLTNVQIYLGLLKMGKPERHVAYLAVLKREADRLQVLIEDLLRVRQLSAEGFEPEIMPGDINQLISDRLVGWGEQAARRGLEFHIQLAPDLPPALIDRDYTAQVIGHVVNNAINYTPAGSITLSTAIRSDETGRWVTISVTDTGPGITSDDLPHIFERFYRGRAAADYKTPGIGVGLSLSREIVTKLNGRLTVETESGAGSTFTIWLPVLGPHRPGIGSSHLAPPINLC
jgi:PAS domain S-box-containing protein